MSDIRAPFGEHLEFQGYTIEPGEDFWRATHDKYWNLTFNGYGGGVLFRAFLRPKQGVDEGQMLRLANDLNKEAALTRFYVDNDGDLSFEGYYPGQYEKARFVAWLDAWLYDGRLIGQNALAGELLS
jgi:hypothetical protein